MHHFQFIENIFVFPNPIKTQLNIEINLSEATTLKGTLVNAKGQSITALFHRNLPIGLSNLSVPFPADFPVGHYFIRLENQEGAIKSISILKI